MVSSLIDAYGDRFAAVEMHINFDGLDTAWGQDRAESFYGTGAAVPLLILDGEWEWPPEDYSYGLDQRLSDPTDVEIRLSAREVQDPEWLVSAVVCLEPTGTAKQMRIYTVQVLDHFPDEPEHSRNLLRQAAGTVDVELDPGSCRVVNSTFVFDADSSGAESKVKIIAWAQEQANIGPAFVYQAAQMTYPFPSGQPAEPELPRDFELPVPLFAGPGSAWVDNVTAVETLPTSASQVLATYRVMCGNTADILPVGPAPAQLSPFPALTYDDRSLPIFAAGSGQQDVLLCDYVGERSYPNPKWGVATEGGPVQVPANAGTVRPAGPVGIDSDGHLVLYDPTTATEYDFWQATTDRQAECQSRGAGRPGPAILQAGEADFFAAAEAGANPSGVRSARPSGTPLLAGLLLPEEVADGVIAHALAVGIPGLRNLSPTPSQPLDQDFFYPAASTETERYSVNPDALAAGQRLRLAPTLVDATGTTVDENDPDQVAPVTRLVLTALRTYGAYVVADAPRLTFYAEDVHTANLVVDDAELNRLIGQPQTLPLPSDKTRWQLVVERLERDLATIPFAQGPCTGASSTVQTANFEVVEPAEAPVVCTGPAISTQPQGASVPSGGSATLSVVATGTEPLTYQWYRGASGDTSDPVAGADANSYATPPLTESTSYWVRVSNDCGSADSATATVTVTAAELPFAYLVPAVAHRPGVGGTLWRTDIAAVNPSGAAAAVQVDFYPVSGDELLSASLAVPAGAPVEWGNVMESMFSQSADAISSGSVAVRSSVQLLVNARTYNQTADGTFGQDLPALTAVEALLPGELGYLPGVKDSTAYRTNLGVVNIGEGSATVEARVFDDAGAPLGNPVSVTVAPSRWYQVNNLLNAAGAGTQDLAYTTVTVDTGSVWVYASVVDNMSGDGTTVPVLVPGTAAKRARKRSDTDYLIPAVAHRPGVGGTLWRTDVTVVNPSATAATLEVEFYPGSGSDLLGASVTLPAGSEVEWGNIMESVFSQPADAISGGSVAVESSVPLVVSSRTYNQTSDGTFGQNLPALAADGEALTSGLVGYLPGVKNNTDYRTNLGAVNLGDGPATVDARVFDGSGDQVGSTVSVSVEPSRWYQVNDLFTAAGAGTQDVAYATVTVTQGSVWTYASVVDNHSGDGTTVPVMVLEEE